MNSTDNTTNPQSNAGKGKSSAPTHVAYHVRESGTGSGKKSFWTRIGAAWPHSDGNGFNLQVDVVPLDGRITLRVADEKRD